MLVPWWELNRRHLTTTQCDKGEERKQRQMAEEELWESAERAFQAYVRPLKTVTSLKYMVQVLTAADNNCTTVVGNLRKARKSWTWLKIILGGEGANPRVSGMFFKAVVKAVLIFGLEMWVLTPRMGRPLEIFQHGVEKWITGRQLKRREEGG